MRIVDAHIASFRSLEDVVVPLDGLTVLTGDDAVVVTDTRDAIVQLLRRVTGGDPTAPTGRVGAVIGLVAGENPFMGTLHFTVDGRSIPGSVDAQITDRIVEQHLRAYYEASGLDLDDAAGRTEVCATALLQTCDPAATVEDTWWDDVRIVAETLAEQPVRVLVGFDVGFEVRLDELAPEVQAAARRVADGFDEPSLESGSYLERTIARLVRTGSAPVIDTEAWLYRADPLCALSCPDVDVHVLVDDIAAAARPLAVRVRVGDSRTGWDVLAPVLSEGGQWLTRIPDEQEETAVSEEIPTFVVDVDNGVFEPPEDAVERVGGVGELGLAIVPVAEQGGRGAESDPTAPVRLDPCIVEAMDLLGRHATRLAPSFIAERGEIRVEVRPPWSWGAVDERLRIRFVPHGGDGRLLDELDPATARWVRIMLRVALDDLLASERGLLDDALRRSEADALPAGGAAAPTLLPFVNSRARQILVIDEPERSLPTPWIESVAVWLEQMAVVHLSVIVTSFSPRVAASAGGTAGNSRR